MNVGNSPSSFRFQVNGRELSADSRQPLPPLLFFCE
jgi:hypothetical protein